MTYQPADSDLRCCAEVSENRACWRPVPLNSRQPICVDHAAGPNVTVSLRLARWARSERTYRAERWRGEDDLPWE